MNKRSLLLIVLLAIVFLGVGYAVISNITLAVQGNATIAVDDSNFSVKFDEASSFTYDKTGAPTNTIVKLNRSSDTLVSFSISNLSQAGDVVLITYPIKNVSETLDAELETPVVNFTNSEYFTVTATLSSSDLIKQTGTANLNVRVEVISTPIDDNVTTSGSISIIAKPKN